MRTRKAQAPAQWRSGFERRIRETLDREEAFYEYEAHTYPLTVAESGVFCKECNSRDIARVTRYTPDFFFPAVNLFVEAKGKFDPRARKVALAFVSQYPEFRYALLFQRDNWMNKRKIMRYSDWCKKHDILHATGRNIPREWYDL